MNFTLEQIERLMRALPGCSDERKRQLVPMILAEWGRIDIENYLSQPRPHELQKERKLLEKLALRANELAHAMSSLKPGLRIAIAHNLSKGKVGPETPFLAWYDHIQEIDSRLAEMPARLNRLSAAATGTAVGWGSPRLRHDSAIRYLILKDLAGIFEFATEQWAGRRIRSDAYVDAGQNYGAFWDFVSAVWPMIFGSTKGLSYAVRFWADARAKHGERSAVIANMNFRHPEWRILER
jgi:hypothetical protein